MRSLLIDPWIMALTEDDDPDLYVTRLLEIQLISKERFLDVRISAHAVELLESDHCYPLSNTLPRPIWPRRQDVYRVVAGIMARLAKIEDQGISEVLVSEIVVAPEIKAVGKQLSHLCDLLSLVAVRSVCAGEISSTIFTLVPPSSALVEVIACVDLIATAPGCDEIESGRYSYNIPLTSCAGDFLIDISAVKLAVDGFIEAAIALLLWQGDRTVDLKELKGSGWILGPAFLGSVQKCGMTTNAGRMASMLHAILVVIQGVDLRRVHALRVGSGGGEDQRTRQVDDARAWRADVDDEIHLHYWRAGSKIEFSCLVFHNDFGII